MAVLTPTEATVAGVAIATVAAAVGGDTFPNPDGRTFLYVNNGGGSPITVTIDSVTPCDQGADHNGGGSVTNGQFRVFGPFSARRFNDSNGQVAVTYSAVTSVTVGAVRLPTPVGG